MSQGRAGCDPGDRGSILIQLIRIIHERIVFAKAYPTAVGRLAKRIGISMDATIAYLAATQILDDFAVAEIPDDFDLVEQPAGQDDLSPGDAHNGDCVPFEP